MDELFYFLERIYRMSSIPVRCIHQSDNVTLFSRGYEDSEDPYQCDPALLANLTKKLGKRNKPILEFEDGIFLYGALNDASGGQIILGPVALGEAEVFRMGEYARRHHMKASRVFIKQSNLIRLTSILATIHFVRNGEKLTETDIAIDMDDTQVGAPAEASSQAYMMDNTEKDIQRMSYSDEKLFMRMVRDGDVDGMKAVEQRDGETPALINFEDRVGRVALNRLKHFEYIACSSIVLSSRAAMEGGMDALSAYALSDVYLQRLEKAKSMADMMRLSQEAMLDYATQVRKILDKRSRSSYVEKSKSYIANHLNQPFTLDDIAEAVGISKPYLSRRFTQEEGMGVMDFVRNKRIEAAANMLRYSDESISTIASYLCFPSQSHFGTVFKKIMGTTPQKYRENQSLVDINAALAKP